MKMEFSHDLPKSEEEELIETFDAIYAEMEAHPGEWVKLREWDLPLSYGSYGSFYKDNWKRYPHVTIKMVGRHEYAQYLVPEKISWSKRPQNKIISILLFIIITFVVMIFWLL